MTSQRFEYIGEGLTIRGGDVDDTIWAVGSGNYLLWFAEGDHANWNEATLTYTDGNNSVTVRALPRTRSRSTSATSSRGTSR